MYYLQSRYYDPEVGRFINADDSEIINKLYYKAYIINITNNLRLQGNRVARYNISEDDQYLLGVYLHVVSLLYQKFISLEYIEGYKYSYDVEILYTHSNNEKVEKLTLYTFLDDNNIYAVSIIGGYARILEIYAYKLMEQFYKTDAFSALLENFISAVSNAFGFVFTQSTIVSIATAIFTAYSFFYGGYTAAQSIQLSQYCGYIFSLTENIDDNEYVTFLYEISKITIVSGNQKKEIIYRFKELMG